MARTVAWLLCAFLNTATALRRDAKQPSDGADDAAVGLQGTRSASFQALQQLLASDELAVPKEKIRSMLQAAPVFLLDSVGNVKLANASTLPTPEVCAMVSNSQTLLEARAGRRIDSVDGPVVRFNGAKTKGFEAHVGNRTDWIMVNDAAPCAWAGRRAAPPRGIKHVLANTFGNGLTTCFPQAARLLALEHINFYVFDFQAMNGPLLDLVHKVAALTGITDFPASPWVTTGMVGAAFLLSLCKEVRHYGFIPAQEGKADNSCRQHYWDPDTTKCSYDKMHNLTAEHVMWAAISSRGNVPGEGIIPGWPHTRQYSYHD